MKRLRLLFVPLLGALAAAGCPARSGPVVKRTKPKTKPRPRTKPRAAKPERPPLPAHCARLAKLDGPKIRPDQLRFAQRVCELVTALRGKPLPEVKIADLGCDHSGKQLWYLSKVTSGTILGISPEKWFPDARARKNCQGNCSVQRGNGLDLKFPDESFDVVLSANVLEHVSDPARYLREAARVLKKGGIAIMEFFPVWSGPRGHHIHEGMMKRWGGKNYQNNGSIIPDWGHLRFTREQMRKILAKRLDPKPLGHTLDFMYNKGSWHSLNRKPWSFIDAAIRGAFETVRIRKMTGYKAKPGAMPTDGKEDYAVEGAFIVGGKGFDVAKLPRHLR